MKYNFCTYFDFNYLSRGLALYYSIARHCGNFRLWILCMDGKTYNILKSLRLDNMELISLEDFERRDKDLMQAKKNRSRIEYYFTCTPSLLLFVFDKFPQVDMLTYIDADIYFLADPLELYREINDSSIAIIEHRCLGHNCKGAAEGIYNVGWLSFRRDGNAFDCLKRWRRQCNEWCYDRLEKGRFADQKYLDDWPKRFKNVAILQHKGANVANWNIGNSCLYAGKNKIFAGGQPLIFFHFHGLIHLFWRLYDTGAGYYKFKLNKTMRSIYQAYIKELLKINRDLARHLHIGLPLGNICRQKKISLAAYLYRKAKQFLYILYYFIRYRSYIIAGNY